MQPLQMCFVRAFNGESIYHEKNNCRFSVRGERVTGAVAASTRPWQTDSRGDRNQSNNQKQQLHASYPVVRMTVARRRTLGGGAGQLAMRCAFVGGPSTDGQ